MTPRTTLSSILLLLAFAPLGAQERTPFEELDVFEVEYPADVQISPDGEWVVYVRTSMSIMRDRREGRLWMARVDGSEHRKLTSGDQSESSPRWSPDGSRIAFVSGSDEGAEVHLHWLATGESARLTQLERSPRDLTWSADGASIAFSMLVPEDFPTLATMPPKPAGAEWADPPRVETRVHHEADGVGTLEPGYSHLFVLPSDGGTPRQITSGDFHHQGPVWSPDGETLYLAANREPDWEYAQRESELYAVSVSDGSVTRITSRDGPDADPAPSPDGRYLAYVGFDDRIQTYQTMDLHLMDLESGDVEVLLPELDRSVGSLVWAEDGKGLYFAYDDEGITKVGFTTLDGEMRAVADSLGGTAVGRPYGGGNFSVANGGRVAFNVTSSTEPGDVAVVDPTGRRQRVTSLNRDLTSQRILADAEMFWTESSHDGRPIQSWVVHPPDFDPSRSYPLLLEIHGGPISNYGDRFSAEVQLYAQAGYVVVYSNPRGSTGYGEEFGNLLYHDYPGNDYDDLMSAVDAVVDGGYVDESRLYVTGGSAGGIMTPWIVGKTDRYRAAVVTKPVVNWISKTLVADNYDGYMHYRYPGTPWENPMGYWSFSPLSLVGEIETPTMVMVGMADLRTPVSEAKQLYHALKLRRIDTALVEIPGAYHNISNRPSQLLAKTLQAIAWFDRYGGSAPVS